MYYQLSSFFTYKLNTVFQFFSNNSYERDFRKELFNKKVDSELSKKFEAYRSDLAHSHELIEVTDFGAGSKIFKSNQRPIHKIAKVAGISNKKARMLLNICNSCKAENILEIGTSLGIGTYALHLANPSSKISSLEGCPNTAAIANRQLSKHGAFNVAITVGNFNKTLEPLLNAVQFDLIYFDGNHSKEATLKYFDMAVNNVTNETVFIFDDIHWSKEMTQVWKIIQKHPKVQKFVTTYEWGILFL